MAAPFLLEGCVEGRDYLVRSEYRGSPVTILSIHGGKMEYMTSEVAAAIAGDDFNLYDFRVMREEDKWVLHIPSERFEEERLAGLLAKTRAAVSIHGEGSESDEVFVGGLDYPLRRLISSYLADAGFSVGEHGRFRGESPENVVNRPAEKGVQLEIGRSLRREMWKDPEELSRFAGAVRSAISEYLATKK